MNTLKDILQQDNILNLFVFTDALHFFEKETETYAILARLSQVTE